MLSQASHDVMAHSGQQPIYFLPIKPKILLHCKSRPSPHTTSPQKENFQSFQASTCSTSISTYQ